MYVCNCNGLRESCVQTAIAAGAATPADIYAHHGCAPRCGKCVPEMMLMLLATEASLLLPATPQLQVGAVA